MTREEAKELLPIIQSFVEGKAIQDKIEGVTDRIDTNEINFERTFRCILVTSVVS